jgi:phage baseplate assembly protein W
MRTAEDERVMLPDFGCGIYQLMLGPNNVAVRVLIEEMIGEALT